MAGLLGLMAAACALWVTRRGPGDFRDGAGLPRPSAFAPARRVLFFGDFGAATPQRDAVAAAMVREHQRSPFDLGFSLGDNIYNCGPDPLLPGAEGCALEDGGVTVAGGYAPPPDPRFEELFHRPLEGLSGPRGRLELHMALGNHDIGYSRFCMPGGGPVDPVLLRRRACLEVAHRGPGWSMPGRRYVVDVPEARFVVFDSNLLGYGDYGGFSFEDELAFLRESLAGCGERLCVLAGHHAPYPAGEHKKDDGSKAFLERLARVEAQGRIDLWLAGHDHDFQHARAPMDRYDAFVAGNTAKARVERFDGTTVPEAKLLFASMSWGFGVLELAAGGYRVRFVDEHGRAIHCCQGQGRGRCQPVACE